MIINPTALDAYIAKKGLTPRVSDAEWEIILQRIVELFGRDLCHRYRLIHQAEDGLRRYSSAFPDSVPQPYRYLHYLEFNASPSAQLSELQEWLTERGVAWHECRQFDSDTKQEQVVGLQIFGYDTDDST